jgi:exonuclease VII small subunit
MPRTINVEKEYVEKEQTFKSQINNLTNIINHLMKKIRNLEDNIKYLQYGLLIEDIDKILNHNK